MVRGGNEGARLRNAQVSHSASMMMMMMMMKAGMGMDVVKPQQGYMRIVLHMMSQFDYDRDGESLEVACNGRERTFEKRDDKMGYLDIPCDQPQKNHLFRKQTSKKRVQCSAQLIQEKGDETKVVHTMSWEINIEHCEESIVEYDINKYAVQKRI